MGRIAKLLSFLRTERNGAKVNDVTADPGGGVNITAEHYSAPGDDSYPLKTDYVALNSDSGTGRETAIGYLDPLNTPKANEGDKRIYGRDSEGAEKNEVWLKNDGQIVSSNVATTITQNSDGSVTVVNDNGAIKLNSDGSITLTTPHGDNVFNTDGSVLFSSGASITTSGDVVTAAGISLDNNTHIGNLGVPTSVSQT